MSEQAALLPVFLKMEGRPCLVVGGGRIALEKIRVLLDTGAAIRVVTREACNELRELAVRHGIPVITKEYERADLNEVPIVIAATNDARVNQRIYHDAVALGRLVNVVDDPAYCDFYFGCMVRRGALQVAISTAGESPAFAQELKREIDDALPANTGAWLEQLGETRRRLNGAIEAGPKRIALLRELARRESCDPATCPCRELAATPA